MSGVTMVAKGLTGLLGGPASVVATSEMADMGDQPHLFLHFTLKQYDVFGGRFSTQWRRSSSRAYDE